MRRRLSERATARDRRSPGAGLVALLAALGAGLPACGLPTGAVVDVMLGATCNEALPEIVELTAEVLPCVDDATMPSGYRCTIGSPGELVPLRQDRFAVRTEDLSGNDPLRILIEDLGPVAARGTKRIRLAISALGPEGLVVAWGAADLEIEVGVIVQQAEPLVLWTTCGEPAGTDYDGDGAVGIVDCGPFDAALVGNLPEVCGNAVDEDCYLGDAPCELPMGNPADVDDDGYCALGAEKRWSGEAEILAFCSVNGFSDCDDLDPSVRDVCRCTDVDGDGWCSEPAACAHDGFSVCNPQGGDCCDGGPTDTGCWAGAVDWEVNPGAAEQCDSYDHDCSGDAWDLAASSCYASSGTGDCLVGLLCQPESGSFGCQIPPGASPAGDAALCNTPSTGLAFECLECQALASWDGTVDAPCGDPTGELTAQIAVPAPLSTPSCAWEVVVPTWPLVVSEAPGSDCATGLFDVNLGAVAGPGLYAVYLRFHDLEGGNQTVVLALVTVEAGTCDLTGDAAVCGVSAGPLCQYW